MNDAFLAHEQLMAFVPTLDLVRARKFYEGVLGFRLVDYLPELALFFDANGTKLRVTSVPELKPQSFTVLGWQVNDIAQLVRSMSEAGIEFVRYPGLNADDPLAIWHAFDGSQVAWFHDPDGNLLSLAQLPDVPVQPIFVPN